MGTSIGIDILKIENPFLSFPEQQQQQQKQPIKGSSGFPNVWIRVPRDDGAAVLAALSSWVGSLSSSSASASASSSAAGGIAEGEEVGGGGVAWRICAKGNYLSAIVHGSGQEIFSP
jgi:ribonuclease P/MRP protein subunit POP8